MYAFAREELDHWEAELGRDLRDGMFGENLTTGGLDIDDQLLGQRWRVGTAVLQVTGPRIPCATFAAWMGERKWVKRFAARGRTGAYLAVIEPGIIESGDAIALGPAPTHGLTVPDYFRAWTGDLDLARRILDLGILSAADAEELGRRVAARA